jgi:hypothetical protein
MKFLCKPASAAVAAVAAMLCHGAGAQPAPPAPDYETGYRAWDLVTDIARQNHRQDISGECGKTFRPFVIPGLKRQTKEEQDLAAAACLDAVRSVCANTKLHRTPDMASKCEGFK